MVGRRFTAMLLLLVAPVAWAAVAASVNTGPVGSVALSAPDHHAAVEATTDEHVHVPANTAECHEAPACSGAGESLAGDAGRLPAFPGRPASPDRERPLSFAGPDHPPLLKPPR